MSGCKTDIDWAAKPEPWCWLGPQFRREIGKLENRPVDFGEIVKIYRRARGWSARELAILCGYETGMIHKIESLEARPSPEKRQRLIEVLGIVE